MIKASLNGPKKPANKIPPAITEPPATQECPKVPARKIKTKPTVAESKAKKSAMFPITTKKKT